MLINTSADLFHTTARVVVNPVNTQGVMGAGVARVFRDLYPHMYDMYKQSCHNQLLTIGRLLVYELGDWTIVNLPTKEHWAHPSDPSYILSGVKKLAHAYNSQIIAMPQIGCGLGGLDWHTQVRPIIAEELSFDTPIYICNGRMQAIGHPAYEVHKEHAIWRILY